MTRKRIYSSVFSILAIVAVFLVIRLIGPTYQGKTLRQWTNDFQSGVVNQQEFDQALRNFNGVPARSLLRAVINQYQTRHAKLGPQHVQPLSSPNTYLLSLISTPEILVTATKTPVPSVRRMLTTSLVTRRVHINHDDLETLHYLEELSRDTDPWVRKSAIELAPENNKFRYVGKSLEILIDRLEDAAVVGQSSIRQDVCWKLMIDRCQDPRALEKIKQLALTGEPNEAAIAAYALLRIADDRTQALEVAKRVWPALEPNARRIALYTFGEIGTEAKSALPLIEEALSSEHDRVKTVASTVYQAVLTGSSPHQ